MVTKNPVYAMDYLLKILTWGYSLGWYSRKLDLITITMQGEFEGWGAYETWGQHFVVKTCAIPELNLPSFEAEGKTIDIACQSLWIQIQNANKIKNGE